ncbi:hypothetical protein [Thermopetrobacter sp. TC1]|nr:hypothetical protein [Thermopetrobacter sp. TC1]
MSKSASPRNVSPLRVLRQKGTFRHTGSVTGTSPLPAAKSLRDITNPA